MIPEGRACSLLQVKIFTRTDPKSSDTSMLVWLRPGYEDLLNLLAEKQHYQGYVYADGGEQYAREVWRLLDPDHKYIQVIHGYPADAAVPCCSQSHAR